MSLKDAYHIQQKLPMPTVQKQINRRKPNAHKLFKLAGKKYRKLKKRESRIPADKMPRWEEPQPPVGSNVKY